MVIIALCLPWKKLVSGSTHCGRGVACMSSFESYKFDNVLQYSIKQAKKLVKDPKV